MPIYEEIYHDIFSRIASNAYQEGMLLPSEKELMAQYACSLAPVRQAMTKLELLGLVERKRGKGTFVKTTNPRDYRQNSIGFTQLVFEERENIHFHTVSLERLAADATVAEHLELSPGDPVVRVTRLGKHHQTVLQYSQHYLPGEGQLALIEAEGDIYSWYFFLAGKLGVDVRKSLDEVYAVLPPPDLRSYFGTAPVPLIVIERVSYDAQQRPQEFSLVYMRSLYQVGKEKIKYTYEVNW